MKRLILIFAFGLMGFLSSGQIQLNQLELAPDSNYMMISNGAIGAYKYFPEYVKITDVVGIDTAWIYNDSLCLKLISDSTFHCFPIPPGQDTYVDTVYHIGDSIRMELTDGTIFTVRDSFLSTQDVLNALPAILFYAKIAGIQTEVHWNDIVEIEEGKIIVREAPVISYDNLSNQLIVCKAVIGNDTIPIIEDFLIFDGVNDYVSFPANIAGTVEGSEFTHTYKVQTLDNYSAPMHLINKGIITTQGKQYGYKEMLTSSEIKHSRDLGTSSNSEVTTSNSNPTGDAFYFTVTYDNGTLKYYIDGTLIDTKSTTTGAIAYHSSYNQGFSIGALRRNVSNQFSNMRLYSVELYDRALSQIEIQNNISGTPLGTPDLISYYKIDEASGSSLTDVVNSYNATISGATWSSEPSSIIIPDTSFICDTIQLRDIFLDTATYSNDTLRLVRNDGKMFKVEIKASGGSGIDTMYHTGDSIRLELSDNRTLTVLDSFRTDQEIADIARDSIIFPPDTFLISITQTADSIIFLRNDGARWAVRDSFLTPAEVVQIIRDSIPAPTNQNLSLQRVGDQINISISGGNTVSFIDSVRSTQFITQVMRDSIEFPTDTMIVNYYRDGDTIRLERSDGASWAVKDSIRSNQDIADVLRDSIVFPIDTMITNYYRDGDSIRLIRSDGATWAVLDSIRSNQDIADVLRDSIIFPKDTFIVNFFKDGDSLRLYRNDGTQWATKDSTRSDAEIAQVLRDSVIFPPDTFLVSVTHLGDSVRFDLSSGNYFVVRDSFLSAADVYQILQDSIDLNDFKGDPGPPGPPGTPGGPPGPQGPKGDDAVLPDTILYVVTIADTIALKFQDSIHLIASSEIDTFYHDGDSIRLELTDGRTWMVRDSVLSSQTVADIMRDSIVFPPGYDDTALRDSLYAHRTDITENSRLIDSLANVPDIHLISVIHTGDSIRFVLNDATLFAVRDSFVNLQPVWDSINNLADIHVSSFYESNDSLIITLTDGQQFRLYKPDVDLTGYATETWVTSNFDDYDYWKVTADGRSVNIGSKDELKLVEGSRINIDFTGNQITISSPPLPSTLFYVKTEGISSPVTWDDEVEIDGTVLYIGDVTINYDSAQNILTKCWSEIEYDTIPSSGTFYLDFDGAGYFETDKNPGLKWTYPIEVEMSDVTIDNNGTHGFFSSGSGSINMIPNNFVVWYGEGGGTKYINLILDGNQIFAQPIDWNPSSSHTIRLEKSGNNTVLKVGGTTKGTWSGAPTGLGSGKMYGGLIAPAFDFYSFVGRMHSFTWGTETFSLNEGSGNTTVGSEGTVLHLHDVEWGGTGTPQQIIADTIQYCDTFLLADRYLTDVSYQFDILHMELNDGTFWNIPISSGGGGGAGIFVDTVFLRNDSLVVERNDGKIFKTNLGSNVNTNIYTHDGTISEKRTATLKDELIFDATDADARFQVMGNNSSKIDFNDIAKEARVEMSDGTNRGLLTVGNNLTNLVGFAGAKTSSFGVLGGNAVMTVDATHYNTFKTGKKYFLNQRKGFSSVYFDSLTLEDIGLSSSDTARWNAGGGGGGAGDSYDLYTPLYEMNLRKNGSSIASFGLAAGSGVSFSSSGTNANRIITISAMGGGGGSDTYTFSRSSNDLRLMKNSSLDSYFTLTGSGGISVIPSGSAGSSTFTISGAGITGDAYNFFSANAKLYLTKNSSNIASCELIGGTNISLSTGGTATNRTITINSIGGGNIYGFSLSGTTARLMENGGTQVGGINIIGSGGITIGYSGTTTPTYSFSLTDPVVPYRLNRLNNAVRLLKNGSVDSYFELIPGSGISITTGGANNYMSTFTIDADSYSIARNGYTAELKKNNSVIGGIKLTAGTGISISPSGTTMAEYVINATGGGGGSVDNYDFNSSGAKLQLRKNGSSYEGSYEIKAGTNITSISSTGTAADRVVTINAKDDNTTYSAGTGLTLSGTTFSLSNTYDNYSNWKLRANAGATQNITSGATVSFLNGTNTTVSRSGNDITINATDTKYTAGTGLTLAGNQFSLTNTYDNYGHWKLQASGGATQNITTGSTVNFKGSGATSVSRSGNDITISSTDNNTTYSAGTGLTLLGTTFSLSNTYDNYQNWKFKVNSAAVQTMNSADQLNLLNGSNVAITNSGKNITIAATNDKYDFNSTNAKLYLRENGSTIGSYEVIAGTGISLSNGGTAMNRTVTISASGGGNLWTASGAGIYRNSDVSIGTTTINSGDFSVNKRIRVMSGGTTYGYVEGGSSTFSALATGSNTGYFGASGTGDAVLQSDNGDVLVRTWATGGVITLQSNGSVFNSTNRMQYKVSTQSSNSIVLNAPIIKISSGSAFTTFGLPAAANGTVVTIVNDKSTSVTVAGNSINSLMARDFIYYGGWYPKQ